MTDDRIAQIEARLSAATPGPWEVRHDDLTDAVYVVHDQEVVSYVCTVASCHADRVDEDADFIAHAPDDLRYLLDALAEAEAGAPERVVKQAEELAEAAVEAAAATFYDQTHEGARDLDGGPLTWATCPDRPAYRALVHPIVTLVLGMAADHDEEDTDE